MTIFLQEVFLFAGIQALTLFTASRFKMQPTLPAAGRASDIIIAFSFLAALLIITALFIFLFKFLRGSAGLMRILWILAIFGGLNFIASAFLSKDSAFLLSLVAVLIYWKAPTVILHNAMLLFALPGIGVMIGSELSPFSAIALLIFLSAYDILAVYGTGHMIELAKKFISSGVVPGIIIGDTKEGTMLVSEVMPGERISVLGTGDLVLPAVLVSSAWFYGGWTPGIITAIFAVIGLAVMHILFFSQKERRPMAALPPIAIASITGFFISKLI